MVLIVFSSLFLLVHQPWWPEYISRLQFYAAVACPAYYYYIINVPKLRAFSFGQTQSVCERAISFRERVFAARQPLRAWRVCWGSALVSQPFTIDPQKKRAHTQSNQQEMADATTLAAQLQKANDATPEEAKKIYQKIIAEGQGAWAVHGIY
jgi:hypothetical protein